MNYEQKYLKYKAKYIQAKQEGGLGGHLNIYFMTDDEFRGIETNRQLNVKYPGTRINYKQKDSGFNDKFHHIVEHGHHLTIMTLNDKNRPVPKKVDLKLGSDGKTVVDKTFKFDYFEKKDLKKVLEEIKKVEPNISKMVLVRDYSALHDVFVAALTIDTSSDDVKLIPQPIELK